MIMILLNIFETTLPLTNPVLKFLVILIIILSAPILLKHSIEADFKIFEDWNDFLIISRDIKIDDNLIIILSRVNKPSYNENMTKIPGYLDRYFQSNSFILLYPKQIGVKENEVSELINPSLTEPIEKLDEIGKNIAKLFRRK